MFEPDSRYYGIETVTGTFTVDDGEAQTIAYKRRRFIPDMNQQPVIVEHRVVQNERLDNITAIYLNDPLQFWRVCDSNIVLHPESLTESGRSLVIRLPRP